MYNDHVSVRGDEYTLGAKMKIRRHYILSVVLSSTMQFVETNKSFVGKKLYGMNSASSF